MGRVQKEVGGGRKKEKNYVSESYTIVRALQS